MKIECFRAKPGNFGDDLNLWLWPRLFPCWPRDTDHLHFIGIGSILDGRHAKLPGRKIVFGSGARKPATVPKLDASWDVRFVRGPLTAAALSLEPSAAITDGAAALLSLDWPRGPVTGGVGFMPHYRSLDATDWPRVCARAGVQFIDPAKPVPEVLQSIGQIDRLITEALHGAIVADLLRVPWQRVCCRSFYFESSEVSEFKWTDWGRSLEVPTTAASFPANPPLPRSWLKRAALFPWRIVNRPDFSGALRRLKDANGYRLSKQPDLDRAAGRIADRLRELNEEIAALAGRPYIVAPRAGCVALAGTGAHLPLISNP